MGDVDHNCGVVVTHTLHDAYAFISSLGHRGRDATGIAAIGDDRIDVVKWLGPASKFSKEDLQSIFPADRYHTYLAHNRYKTRGAEGSVLIEAHPHTIGGKRIDRERHSLITDCDAVGVHNGQINDEYLQSVDLDGLLTSCDSEAFLHLFARLGAQETLKQVPGAYVFAGAIKGDREVVVMRDRTGIKPACIGVKDGKTYVASESVAFTKNGGGSVRDMPPGSICYILPEGGSREKQVVDPERQSCFFEHAYVASPDSLIDGILVNLFRERMGEKLAKRFNPDDAKFVTDVPHCPRSAAEAYARSTGKEYLRIFYKMDKERSFQGATNGDRAKSIASNLNLIPWIEEKIRGEGVIVIDDSIVRGNVIENGVVPLLNEAGVGHKYFFSYTPKIGIVGADGMDRGCEFGVDMPANENDDHSFLARGLSTEEISAKVGMDVRYLSVEDMNDVYRSLGKNPDDLCTFCIGGRHPFEESQSERYVKIGTS